MAICVNCGVELEDDMKHCPLCGTKAGVSPNTKLKASMWMEDESLHRIESIKPEDRSLLHRIMWQVTSILLFSGIISTVIIDLTINGLITWSVYPITICAIIFTYSTLFEFWRTKKIYQIMVGLLISSTIFFVLDFPLSPSNWPTHLGVPLLCAVNLVAATLIVAINKSKQGGLNIIAYTCVAMAVLCISIECILCLYKSGNIVLRWSVIVSACLLPVTTALLFMHHRIKKNPNMEKIFHT
jgi:hypothetical protein